MTDTPAHTPLPWRYTRSFGTIEIVPNGTQQPLAGIDFDAEEDRANAAFIVRACNSHYQLVSALRGLLDEITKSPSADSILDSAAAGHAFAALSQAGGASE